MAIPAKTTDAIAKLFLDSLERDRKVMSLFRTEYEEVGFWKGLWLKLTGRKPRMILPPLPTATSDTVTFRRPTDYRDK